MGQPSFNLKKGGIVGAPPSDEVALFADAGGNVKRLLSTGALAGLSLSRAWVEARLAAIQAMVPTLTRVKEFDCTSLTGDVKDIAGNGATATVTMSTPTVGHDGGVIALDTVSGANSYRPVVHRDYDATGTNVRTPAMFTNPKTRPWAIVARVNLRDALTTDENAVFAPLESLDATKVMWGGLFGSSVAGRTQLGFLIAPGGTTDFVSNLVMDTGNWHDVAAVFDAGAVNGTPTIWMMLDDVRSATGQTDLTNAMTVVGQPGKIHYNNKSFTGSRKFWLAKYMVVTPDVLRPDGG